VILLGMSFLLLLGMHAPPTDMDHVQSRDPHQKTQHKQLKHKRKCILLIFHCYKLAYTASFYNHKHTYCTRLKAVCIIPIIGAM
jgi:hypothetical protein